MAKLICLQAGHQNAKNNCDPALRKGTGAPGEVEFTIRIRDRLSQVLISKGFQVQLVDATFNCDPKADKTDYALFLAIHYDADIYGTGGGFIDFPEPSTDQATAESIRIRNVIEEEYFKHSGIVNYPGRSNANTRFYYMWKFLSGPTPCNIIECGVGQDAHDKVILADTDRVANAIARGICAAFSVSFDQIPPSPPSVDYKAKFEALRLEFEAYKKTSDKEILDKANKILELQEKIEKATIAVS